MKRMLFASAPVLWLALAIGAPAQSAAPAEPQVEIVHTFYLKNSVSTNDSNEVLTAVRVLLPPTLRVYLDVHQNAIIVRATAEQIAQIQQIIDALDRPVSKAEPEPARNSFRLTYTVSELDGGKRISLQHFATVIVEGGHTTLKDGTTVPVRSGQGPTSNMAQFTYIDLGLNVDSSLENSSNGERLRAKIDQSSALPSTQSEGSEPVRRQASLELTAYLTPGKPLVLGAVDIPGSSQHLEIEALLEPVR